MFNRLVSNACPVNMVTMVTTFCENVIIYRSHRPPQSRLTRLLECELPEVGVVVAVVVRRCPSSPHCAQEPLQMPSVCRDNFQAAMPSVVMLLIAGSPGT